MKLQETIHREVSVLGEQVVGYTTYLDGYTASYEVGARVIKLNKKEIRFDNLNLPREVGTYDVWNVIDDEPLIWNSEQFFKYARRILEVKTGYPLTGETRSIACVDCSKTTTPDRTWCIECDPKFYSYNWRNND